MLWRFSERAALLDDHTEEFLKTLAYLGGYCTVGPARRMGLAQSTTRAFNHLKCLEGSGLLRRVSNYPAVYQVTKPVMRLLGHDLRARRRHVIETVRNRLLGVSFYLDALRWPAEFVFDPQQKIAAFQDYATHAACSLSFGESPSFLARLWLSNQRPGSAWPWWTAATEIPSCNRGD